MPPLDASVLWTRGEGCKELAQALASGQPVRVGEDMTTTAIRHRAGLLVARRFPASDLLPVVVPVDLRLDEVAAVVAAVAGGPNSEMAARLAGRLGERLGVPASMVCAVREGEDTTPALATIEGLYASVPSLEYRIVEADDAPGLIETLPEGSLLVLGAPGGNWFQRTVFSRGVRLRQRAPHGAVVVRSVGPRVFQFMEEPVFASPLREAGDVLRTHPERILGVVEGGELVGLVRREVLERAAPGTPLSVLMDAPAAIPFDALLTDVDGHFLRFGNDPVPVVDDKGRLLGGVRNPE